ncbi:MAG: DUF1080 domain-containing protein [Planctomycetes bacterium]|nr:DUF1080 domain-containing protein [Planctomycetota bacterium]
MLSNRVLLSIAGACAILTISSCKSGGAAADATGEAGFHPIFNGRDLDGWVYGTQGGKPDKAGAGYRVRDGAIYCTVADGGNLYTEKEYDNFILKFEFRLTPNANNGIGIRAPLEGDAAYVGMEIQVLDDSGSEYKNLQPWQFHGSIYNVVAARLGTQKPVGEWNSEEISADGRRIRVFVNDRPVVDANLDDVKDPETLKKHPGLARNTGRIGFLGHGARVEFRNLRIKEL